MADLLVSSGDQDTEDHWISISDMMAGLMMVFLFISVLYMLQVMKDKVEIEVDRNKIEKIAITYKRIKDDLYKDLEQEFKEDFINWDAELDRDLLSIRFKEPDVLFLSASTEVREEFKKILDDFFPRYIGILTRPEYIDDIEEIRIEGHTSSEWIAELNADMAYIKNMELSQGRTRSVLEYILSIHHVDLSNYKAWLISHLTANGLSSSKLISVDGLEDKISSRRVEFRIRTNAEDRIEKIIYR